MRSIELFKTLLLLTLLVWPAGSASATERLSVGLDVANVRSGPSLKAQTLWQVEKYYPFVVIEKKGEWRRIKDFEGDQGWMHISTLAKTPTVIVKSNHCNLRTGPGTQYDIALTVDKGIPFKVLKTKGQWLEVQHADGDQGWVFQPLVW